MLQQVLAETAEWWSENPRSDQVWPPPTTVGHRGQSTVEELLQNFDTEWSISATVTFSSVAITKLIVASTNNIIVHSCNAGIVAIHAHLCQQGLPAAGRTCKQDARRGGKAQTSKLLWVADRGLQKGRGGDGFQRLDY